MSETITSSSVDDQWIQYQPNYQYQNFDECVVPPAGSLSDSISGNNNMLAPENSCAVGSDLSPRASIGKPVRRRSRTSRRTPTTLLNASIKNFRTLVQQYTGCHSVSNSSLKTTQKGPINLSFGSLRDPNNNFAATNNSSGDGRSYISGQSHFQEQNQQYQQQHQEYLHHHHHQMYDQGQQQGLLTPDENDFNLSDFSSSGQNMMNVNNYGWQ